MISLPHVDVVNTRVSGDKEPWAVERLQRIHVEPLLAYGERVVLRKVWRYEDLEAGRVQRCSECQGSSVESRLTEIYKDTGDSRCFTCFGTGFEGGFQPLVYVTYMLARSSPDTVIREKSGMQDLERPTVELPAKPRVNEGDLIVRVLEWDETKTIPVVTDRRFIVDDVQRSTIRDALSPASLDQLIVGYTVQLSDLPKDHFWHKVQVI